MNRLRNKILNENFQPVIKSSKPYKRLDFSASNSELIKQEFESTNQFSEYVFQIMLEENRKIGVGGYGEKRIIYSKLRHFGAGNAEARDLHLGTDIWADEGTIVYAPLNGYIHSFAFNNHEGDYGPTIILRHQVDNNTFFTLYGHLSQSSLEGIEVGQEFKAGQVIGSIGNLPENGNWPPHLHFQIIEEIGSYIGDYPGVCHKKDSDYYFQNCPNPNLILRIAENNA